MTQKTRSGDGCLGPMDNRCTRQRAIFMGLDWQRWKSGKALRQSALDWAFLPIAVSPGIGRFRYIKQAQSDFKDESCPHTDPFS